MRKKGEDWRDRYQNSEKIIELLYQRTVTYRELVELLGYENLSYNSQNAKVADFINCVSLDYPIFEEKDGHCLKYRFLTKELLQEYEKNGEIK